MGIDSKGVYRGRCTRCSCQDFYTKTIKCRCGHAPTHHEMKYSPVHVSVDGHSPAGEAAGKMTYSKIVSSGTTSANVSKAMFTSNPSQNKGKNVGA